MIEITLHSIFTLIGIYVGYDMGKTKAENKLLKESMGNSMSETSIIEGLIAKIILDIQRKEKGNTYVYGVDDVLRLLHNELNIKHSSNIIRI